MKAVVALSIQLISGCFVVLMMEASSVLMGATKAIRLPEELPALGLALRCWRGLLNSPRIREQDLLQPIGKPDSPRRVLVQLEELHPALVTQNLAEMEKLGLGQDHGVLEKRVTLYLPQPADGASAEQLLLASQVQPNAPEGVLEGARELAKALDPT